MAIPEQPDSQTQPHSDRNVGGGLQVMETLHKALELVSTEAPIVEVFRVVLHEVCLYVGWPAAHVYLMQEGRLEPSNIWFPDQPDRFTSLREATASMSYAKEDGSLPGRVAASRKPIWVMDVNQDPYFLRAKQDEELDIKAALAVPVTTGESVVAVLEFFSKMAEPPDSAVLESMQALGLQIGRIVELREAESALRAREERLRALTESATEAIITADQKGQIVGWNQGAVNIFGYRREEVLGRPLTLLIPEVNAEVHLKGMAQFLATGEGQLIGKIIEVEGVRKGGMVFPIELSLSNWRANGEIFTAGIIRDITARRAVEQALRESEERSRLLFAAVKDAIILVETETHMVVDANQAALRLYGFSREELMGKHAHELSAQKQASKDGLVEVASGEDNWMVQKQRFHQKKDGTIFPVEISAGKTILSDQTMICAVIRDVTQRYEDEALIRKSRTQLRRLAARIEAAREEERTRLSREVHDNLGQVLTGLRVDITMMERGLCADQHNLWERLETMKASIDETIQVVRRIAHDLRPGLLDDLGVVAALEWETRKFAGRTGLTCTFENHIRVLPDLDPERSTAIFRIGQELLTNVVRHAQAKRVEITLSLEDAMLILSVRDDGRGIRPKEHTESTSLGILGINERLRPWNGTIHFEGKSGQGTTALVCLPLQTQISGDAGL